MDQNNQNIYAVGGGGGGGGGGPDGGRGGDGGSVIIGIPPEKVSITHLKNPHEEYWGFLFRNIKTWFIKHKKFSFTAICLLILVGLAYLGYINYTPEFNSFIGTFRLKDKVLPSESPESRKLDRSIFSVSNEIESGSFTSQQRVNYINNISGLETNQEQGKVEDIGTDGLTLLISGNNGEGGYGIIRCDFSTVWKQRLSLLKKGDQIKFIGILSKYELSRDWIVLNECQISK
jgi:hypothetical protein